MRGEYGSGKTFFARWLQERARATGFATSEVQISETETPLHRWEAVYRRLVERLATSDTARRCAAADGRCVVLYAGGGRSRRGQDRRGRRRRACGRDRGA